MFSPSFTGSTWPVKEVKGGSTMAPGATKIQQGGSTVVTDPSQMLKEILF